MVGAWGKLTPLSLVGGLFGLELGVDYCSFPVDFRTDTQKPYPQRHENHPHTERPWVGEAECDNRGLGCPADPDSVWFATGACGDDGQYGDGEPASPFDGVFRVGGANANACEECQEGFEC